MGEGFPLRAETKKYDSKYSKIVKNTVTIITLSPTEPEEFELKCIDSLSAIDSYLQIEKLFVHNSDFSHVVIHDEEYSLIPNQAKAIKFLHQIHLRENGNEFGVDQNTVHEAVHGQSKPDNWNIEGSLFKNRKDQKNYDRLVIRVADGKWRLNL